MMAVLGRIPDPAGGDIVGKGRVQAPRIKDGVASLILDVTGLSADARAGLERRIRAAMVAVPDVNDIRFWLPPGFATGNDFFTYLKDSFDVLYAQAARGPRMMSIGLHPRIIGRPGRVNSLRRFIEYAKQFPDAWFATREEIARAWLQQYG